MSKKTLLLLCILLLGALLRFIWIDRIPNSINGDQLYYILNSKSFLLTGKDISQSVTPLDILAFRHPASDLAQAELTFFLDMPAVNWLPLSLTANAFSTTTLSLLLILVMYLIGKKLFDERTALIIALITAINPWLIALGRTSYEMVAADFFYLCSFYILLNTKKWKILLALPVIFLAFYAYIATKLIFLPLIFAFCAYGYFVVNKKKYALQYSIVLLASVLFVGFFSFQSLVGSGQSRVSELITPNSPFFSDQVNWLRKDSLANPLLSLFENKYTVYIKTLSQTIFDTLSPNFLFMHGDLFFLQGKHGLFYAIDFIFLLIGGYWILLKNKKLFFFLLTFCVLAILPHIFHKTSIKNGNFSPHITLLIPFFIFFIGAGVSYVVSYFSKNKIILATTIILFAVSVGNFMHVYFFQMPMQPNYYNFSDRLLAQYLFLNQKQNKNVFVYAPDNRGKFKQYLFYANAFTKNNATQVITSMQNKNYKIGNATFLSCDKSIKTFDKNTINIFHIDCDMTVQGDLYSIPQLVDSGAVYKISNDTICRNYNLKPFISGFTIHDFDLDKLSPQQFCETFIMGR